MIYALTILYSLAFAIHQVDRKNGKVTKWIKSKIKIWKFDWHLWQSVHLVMMGILSVAVWEAGLINLTWIPFAMWLFNDGFNNIIDGKDWWHISETSGSVMEKHGKWYIKIPLLLAGVAIQFL